MTSEADLGLVKLVVMTNVFFNYHQHEIEIKRLICVKTDKVWFLQQQLNSTFLFMVYVKRENWPLQKTKFSAKFSSSAF